MNRQQQEAKRLPQVIAAPQMGLFVCDDVLLVAAAHTVGKIDPGLERPKHER